MHAGALLGQVDGEDLVDGVGLEEPLGQRLHGARACALAHADEHGAAPEDQHVAALQARGTVHVVAPHLLARTGEERVAAVDRAEVQGLASPRRVGHVVDAHAAVDPARRVAGEEVVGQRRDHESEPVDRGGQAAGREGKLVEGDAADEDLRQTRGCQLAEPAAQAAAQSRAQIDLAQRLVDEPGGHAVDRERLGQQLLEIEDLDATPAQSVGEGVVLLTGPADPGNVVEQQLVLVGRGEAAQLEVGAMEDDAPQRADLRAHVQASGGRGGRERGHANASSRPCAAFTRAAFTWACADASGITSCAVSRPRHHMITT